MKMSKEEKVQKLLPEYFAGRSEAFKAKFYNYPPANQYANIMAWYRRTYMKNREPMDIVKNLKQINKYIQNGAELSEADIKKVGRELNYIREALTNYDEIRRQQQIASLELEAQAIARKLEALRNNAE